MGVHRYVSQICNSATPEKKQLTRYIHYINAVLNQPISVYFHSYRFFSIIIYPTTFERQKASCGHEAHFQPFIKSYKAFQLNFNLCRHTVLATVIITRPFFNFQSHEIKKEIETLSRNDFTRKYIDYLDTTGDFGDNSVITIVLHYPK